MGLADTLRAGVAVANSVTASLQAAVTHEAWTGTDDHGKPSYAAAVSRQAVVELRQHLVRTKDGQEVAARAVVTFLAPVAANGAEGRREPIDPRDRITLPDGSTGPILDVSGVVDPSTGLPYAPEVSLG